MIIFNEDLDLYKLHVMLRCFELTEYEVYRRKQDATTRYLLITQVTGYTLSQADKFKIAICGERGDCHWSITLPYQGETRITFIDPFGSNNTRVGGGYDNVYTTNYSSLNPVYYEIVQCLIRMGVKELDDVRYCVAKTREIPFYLFGT